MQNELKKIVALYKQYEAVCAASGLMETHSKQLKVLKQKALLAQTVYKKQAAEDAENGILPAYLQKELNRFLKENKEKLTADRRTEIKKLLVKYYITNVAKKESSKEPMDLRMAKAAYDAIKIELGKNNLNISADSLHKTCKEQWELNGQVSLVPGNEYKHVWSLVKDKEIKGCVVNIDFEVVAKVKNTHNAIGTATNPNPDSTSFELVVFERAFEPFKGSFTTAFAKIDFFSKSPLSIPGWDWLTFHCEMNPLSEITTKGNKLDLKIPITFKAKATLTEDTAQYAANSDLGGLLKFLDMEVAAGITASISALDAKMLKKLNAAQQKMTKSLDDLIAKAEAVHQKDIELNKQLEALEEEYETAKGKHKKSQTNKKNKENRHGDVKKNIRRMRKDAEQIRDAKKRAAYLKKLELAEKQLQAVRRKAIDALAVVRKYQSKVDELAEKVASKTGKILSSQSNKLFGKFALKLMQKGLLRFIPFVNVIVTLMDVYDLLILVWESGAGDAINSMMDRPEFKRLKHFLEELGLEEMLGELGAGVSNLIEQLNNLSVEQFEALLQELKKNPQKVNVQEIPVLLEQMMEQLASSERGTSSDKVEVIVEPCDTCDFDNGQTKLVELQKLEITKIESIEIGDRVDVKRYLNCVLDDKTRVNVIVDVYFLVTKELDNDTLLLETDKHFVFEVTYGELSKRFVYYKGNKMKYFPKTGNYEIIK